MRPRLLDPTGAWTQPVSTGGPESLGLSSKHLLFLTMAWELTPPNQEIKPMVSQLPIISLAGTNGISHVLWVETEKTARPCPTQPRQAEGFEVESSSGRRVRILPAPPPPPPRRQVLEAFPRELDFRLPWEGGSHSV